MCNSAVNFRQLVNNSCICPNSYFDDYLNNNYVCQTCPYSCQTCVGISQCSSCNIAYQRIPNTTTGLCSCANGYYDDNSNQACQPCTYDCLTCSSATACILCQTDRTLNPSTNRCDCNSAFYANGTSCSSCPV